MKAGRPATQEELMLQLKPKAAHAPSHHPLKKTHKVSQLDGHWARGIPSYSWEGLVLLFTDAMCVSCSVVSDSATP